MAEGSRVRVHAFKTIVKYLSNTVYIGFCDYGFSGQSSYSDHNFDDQPPSLHDNDPCGNNLKFRPLRSILGSDLLIPIPVLVLSSPGARFRFKF